MMAVCTAACRATNSGRREQGFALALTLWILAAIMISAAIFSERVHHAVNLAQHQQQNIDDLLDLAATQAEILFRLGVTPMSLYGLGTEPEGKSIALDNRMYRGIGTTTVRLQDDRGLVNLNIVTDDRLMRLLSIVDVPEDKRSMLIDTLHDYIDADSFKRINGAEAPEYLELGLPPPRNNNLLTPYEAKNIIGWRDLPQLWENNRLPDLTTTSHAVAVNPNTAPKEVLATLPGVTGEIADAIVAQRQLAPIASEYALAQLVGVPPNLYMMNVISLPADSVRVTLHAADLPWAIQYNVTLTSNSDKAPWRIDYYYKVRHFAPAHFVASVAANPFANRSGLYVTPGLTDNRAHEIPELPPRYTLAISAASTVLSAPR